MAAPARKKDDQNDEPNEGAQATKAPAEDRQSQEDAQVQAVASTRSGGVQGPTRDPGTSDEDLREQREEVSKVSTHLNDLDRDTLTALASAVESALSNKGHDAPGASGPSLEEISGSLPVHEKATKDLDASKAAGAFDDDDDPLEEESIVSYAVRQAHGIGGTPVGPKYVRVVTADGRKRAAKL